MQSGLKDVFKKVVTRSCFIGITEKICAIQFNRTSKLR